MCRGYAATQLREPGTARQTKRQAKREPGSRRHNGSRSDRSAAPNTALRSGRQPDAPALYTKHRRDEHLLLLKVNHGQIELHMEVLDSIKQHSCHRKGCFEISRNLVETSDSRRSRDRKSSVLAQQGLMNLAMAAFTKLAEEMMQWEVTSLTGPTNQPDSFRDSTRWGTQGGYCVVGGQKVPLQRPRVRRVRDMRHEEVPLGSYEMLQRASLIEDSVWHICQLSCAPPGQASKYPGADDCMVRLA
jgi:hypothetical protein